MYKRKIEKEKKVYQMLSCKTKERNRYTLFLAEPDLSIKKVNIKQMSFLNKLTKKSLKYCHF